MADCLLTNGIHALYWYQIKRISDWEANEMNESRLTISPRGGGYTLWAISDQGIQVEVVGVRVTPDDARAEFAERMTDPNFIRRLEKAWAFRGYTFQNLKS